MNESEIQQRFISWRDLWAQRPGYEDLAWVFAVPNGGARSKATAGRMKSEGVTAGVADVLWLRPGQYGVTAVNWLALEFKIPGGRQSAAQRAFADFARLNGGAYHVVLGAGAAALLVCAYAGWGGDIHADALELVRRDSAA